MPLRARRRASGFTLIEVIVALAVVLILAAVALPQLTGFLDQERIEASASQLATVRDALFRPGGGTSAFFQTVGSNAGRLSELTTSIATTNDFDSCGTTFTNPQKNNWANGGPFVNFVIDRTSGMATPLGQATDVLTRISAGGTTYLRMSIPNASLADAEALDQYVDITPGWNAGTVRWTPQLGTNGVVTELYYFVVINGTC